MFVHLFSVHWHGYTNTYQNTSQPALAPPLEYKTMWSTHLHIEHDTCVPLTLPMDKNRVANPTLLMETKHCGAPTPNGYKIVWPTYPPNGHDKFWKKGVKVMLLFHRIIIYLLVRLEIIIIITTCAFNWHSSEFVFSTLLFLFSNFLYLFLHFYELIVLLLHFPVLSVVNNDRVTVSVLKL